MTSVPSRHSYETIPYKTPSHLQPPAAPSGSYGYRPGPPPPLRSGTDSGCRQYSQDVTHCPHSRHRRASDRRGTPRQGRGQGIPATAQSLCVGFPLVLRQLPALSPGRRPVGNEGRWSGKPEFLGTDAHQRRLLNSHHGCSGFLSEAHRSQDTPRRIRP